MWCTTWAVKRRHGCTSAARTPWCSPWGLERAESLCPRAGDGALQSGLARATYCRRRCQVRACAAQLENAVAQSLSGSSTVDLILIAFGDESAEQLRDEPQSRINLPALPGATAQRIGKCPQGVACVATMQALAPSEAVLAALRQHLATTESGLYGSASSYAIEEPWVRRVQLRISEHHDGYLDEALDALIYYMKCRSFFRTVDALTDVLRSVASQMARGGDVTILSREPDVVRSLGALLFARTELIKQQSAVYRSGWMSDGGRSRGSTFEQLDAQVFHARERLAYLEPDLATLRDGLVLMNSQIEFRINSRIERMILLLLAVEVVFAIWDAFF